MVRVNPTSIWNYPNEALTLYDNLFGKFESHKKWLSGEDPDGKLTTKKIAPWLIAYHSLDVYDMVDMVGSILDKADLSEADLIDCRFIGSSLRSVNFTDAILSGSDLTVCDLQDANFSGARLDSVNFQDSDLSGADLTGAVFHRTSFEGWRIAGVKCDFAFWGESGEKRVDYAPGEFEALYRSCPMVEYVFDKGMHPMATYIMSRLEALINEQNPEYELQIESIVAAGATPRIRFRVKDAEAGREALAKISAAYESTVEGLRLAAAESEAQVRTLEKRLHMQVGEIRTMDKQLKAANETIRTISLAAIATRGVQGDLVHGDKVTSVTETTVYQELAAPEVTHFREDMHAILQELKAARLDRAENEQAMSEILTMLNELKKPKPDGSKVKESFDLLTKTVSTLPKAIEVGGLLAKFMGLDS